MASAQVAAIDAELLMEALTRPFEWEAYLDLDSGDVVIGPLPEEDEDADEDDEGDPGSRIHIPRLESREEYQLMVRFTAGVEEDDLRERLVLALDGRGAFGRFRHVLQGYPDLRAQWEAMRRAWLLEEAREWLGSLDIECTLSEASPQPSHPPLRLAPPRISLIDLLLLGAPEGKTELLEGTVSRVFVATSPGEARAVFKSLAREICEHHGIAWRNRFIEGRDTYALERLSLHVDGVRVELSVQVTSALWRRFGG